jgi:hypothetical protein
VCVCKGVCVCGGGGGDVRGKPTKEAMYVGGSRVVHDGHLG